MNLRISNSRVMEIGFETQPCYVISVAARIVGVHAQTLRYYERLGLVEPARSSGNIRLYSPKDVQLLLRIKSLMEDLGVNLAGVEVIIRMSRRMAEMEQEVQRLMARIEGTGELDRNASTKRGRSSHGH